MEVKKASNQAKQAEEEPFTGGRTWNMFLGKFNCNVVDSALDG